MLLGLVYAWQTRFILFILVLSALKTIFGRSYRNFLPIFACDIWHGSAQRYGLLLWTMEVVHLLEPLDWHPSDR